MTGEYGDVYNIDPNIIISWLKRYWRGRLDVGERVTLNEHQAEQDKPIVRDASWSKAFEEFSQNLKNRRHGQQRRN